MSSFTAPSMDLSSSMRRRRMSSCSETITVSVFEEARRSNWGYVPLTPPEIAEIARDMKPALDPQIVLLAEPNGVPANC